MKRTLALVLLASGLPLLAEELALELDPARTEIHFTLGDPLHTIRGTFQLKRGTIRFDPATGKAGGEVIVDVASGDSGGRARDRRMHKDILQSDRFPEASFAPDRIEGRINPEGESKLDIHGLFTIHGAAHEVTLHSQVQMKGGEVSASTHFSIPYVKWGMKNPSTFVLRVADHVEIDLNAVGRK
jgi:polyisoprenoid-binding protein YceI